MFKRNEKNEKLDLVERCFVMEETESERNSLITDNRGIGVVEIVLILVVLVALVLIFKDKIMEIINDAFSSISDGADSL